MNRLVIAGMLIVPLLGLTGCADDGTWSTEVTGFIPDCDGDGDNLVSADEFGSCDGYNINPIEFNGGDSNQDGYLSDQEYQDYINSTN